MSAFDASLHASPPFAPSPPGPGHSPLACVALRFELRHTRALSQDGESLLLRTSLGEMPGALDPQPFRQIHRDSVVHARAIERIERRDDGELWVHARGPARPLPVSRTHRGRFRGM